MNRLTSKLGRDLLRLRWQVASLAIVVASGVTIFVASISTYGSLIRARDDLYLDTRFPDVFVRLSRAPRAVADQLAAQSGVAAVEPRLTFDVPLDLPGVDEPIAARIVSLPPEGRAGLGRLVLRRGRLPGARERSAVAVSEAFAEARRLSAGDRITAVLDGRRQELTIVGVALSSEHVAAFQGGEVIPEDARFGILWLPYDAVAAAFHAESSFNEAVFALAPGAREEAVIADVDRVLAPYGGLGAHGRSEQRSSRFVGSELGELEVLATVLPVIFLAIATFLTNVVLARIVVQERTQIATLRALGFRVGTIARHYLAFALVIAGLGSTVGILLGVVLGRRMTALYTDFFRFPVLEQRVDVLLDLVDAPDRYGRLGDGYRVETRIVVQEIDRALLVPASALFRDGGRWRAFEITEGRVHRRDIRVLASDGLTAVVGGGLTEGARVVLQPPASLRDGERVEPR